MSDDEKPDTEETEATINPERIKLLEQLLAVEEEITSLEDDKKAMGDGYTAKITVEKETKKAIIAQIKGIDRCLPLFDGLPEGGPDNEH